MVTEQLISEIIYEYSYLKLYFLVFVPFLFLYFGLAPLFVHICKRLEKKGYLNKVVDKEVSRKQVLFEVKHSFKSIVVFGFSAWPILYLARQGNITFLEDNIVNTLIGVVALTLWNELHFFVVHRIMHLPFFMKNVHYIHHKSRIPTVYSVYSFHWLEAFLLSLVPLGFVLLFPLSPMAMVFYPLASILLNYAGHCNYRFGTGNVTGWRKLGTLHNEHHSKGRRNYGFATDILDRLNLYFTNKH